MARLYCIVCLALFAGAAAAEVTPIEKVISLIEGMATEVDTEGRKEAAAYDTFACFCKDTTGNKVKSVNKGAEKIGLLSADIADKTQERKDNNAELAKRKGDQEQFNKELDETNARCAKQKAEYQAEAADLEKAIQGLKDAIKAMSGSKPSFLAIKQTLGKTFAMAEAMNMLKAPKHRAVASFIQSSNSVDPNDPEYNFHSDDIISVCNELLVEYKGSKKDLDTEWGKTKKGCTETKASLKKSIGANSDAMNQLDKDIERLAKEIAQHRVDLVTSQGVLKDDELYLKDLTARCENRANDYDQRSAMRNDELGALNAALDVLKKNVKGNADKANVRAMLVQEPIIAAKLHNKATEMVASLKSVSFLQEVTSSVNTRAFLGLTQSARKEKALNVLRQAGKKVGSLILTSLAENAAGNPFKKIKGLIQKFIERLLQESAGEATKKGFCDTELGKARKDRDFRFQEAQDLSADLAGLEAKQDELKAEIKDLKSDIKQESLALKETTKERKTEKDNNMDTLKTAKAGLEGVNEALLILRSFYKQAAKAAFVQASPVDEDAPAVAKGNYKGNQSGSKAVLGLLETIASDFDRTLRKTEESEAAAHREYVAFSQASQASIAGKQTKQELDEQDLKTTETSLATKSDDMQTAVDLLDSALKTLEELKPTCIDTGMSYSERVKKREEEMKALGVALCLLDEEKVEKECK